MVSFALTAVRASFMAFGERAKYEAVAPLPLGVQDISVIPVRPDAVVDAFDSSIHSRSSVFEIQVEELPAPQRGGVIVFTGTRYVIQGYPRYKDPRRLVWRVDTYEE